LRGPFVCDSFLSDRLRGPEGDGLSATGDAELFSAPRLIDRGGGFDFFDQLRRTIVPDVQDQGVVGKKSQILIVSIDLVLPVGEHNAGRIDTDENALLLCSGDGISPFGGYAATTSASAASCARTAMTIFP